MRIGVLGATGQVGRALSAVYGRREGVLLDLYSTRPAELAQIALADRLSVHHFDSFPARSCDVVLDCTGAGDARRIAELGQSLVTMSRDLDARLLDAVAAAMPDCILVSFSSGVVFGSRLDSPVTAHSELLTTSDDAYVQAKLDAEARHRDRDDLNIVDLRLFGFFSRFQDLDGQFLLSQAAAAIVRGDVLQTTAEDIARDFVLPEEVARMIDCCARRRPLNAAFNAMSQAPVWKFELLDALSAEFGLRYTVVPHDGPPSERRYYYADRTCNGPPGFQASRSALQGILDEMPHLLRRRGARAT